MEVGYFKKFIDVLNKIQVNIPFFEALEQMSVYAKFMKELLSRKCKLTHDKNITLEEEYITVIQGKLPLELIDPRRFIS